VCRFVRDVLGLGRFAGADEDVVDDDDFRDRSHPPRGGDGDGDGDGLGLRVTLRSSYSMKMTTKRKREWKCE
jgi:hypothetical protein